MSVTLGAINCAQQTHDARDEFACVFQRLLGVKALTSEHCAADCQQKKQLATDLRKLVQSCQSHLLDLPRYDTYSRHIIGTDDGWVGFICRWEKNITSSIHGHPSVAYYQVLDGSVAMDFYEPIDNTKARRVSSRQVSSGDSVLSITQEGQFDNLVHRVRTEESPAFTLHLYSDDPGKGRVFQAV